MSCTCNEPQTSTRPCYNKPCGNTVTRQLGHHERMAGCPVHHWGIAICSGPAPLLCPACTAAGYAVTPDYEEMGFVGPGFKVVKM